jgi:sRNA-binding protein
MLGLMLFAGQAQAAGSALVDPTRPWSPDRYQQRQPHTDGSYTLNSTLVSSARRVAVINGRHVSEGETVGNATVLEIRKHDVVLQTPHRQITLQLLPDIVKKQP